MCDVLSVVQRKTICFDVISVKRMRDADRLGPGPGLLLFGGDWNHGLQHMHQPALYHDDRAHLQRTAAEHCGLRGDNRPVLTPGDLSE